MIDAITPAPRPIPNSTSTGIRYTNCGITCAKSRNGRITRSATSERPAHRPSGIATSTLIRIATSTWLNVSIARSHSWVRPVGPPGISPIAPITIRHTAQPTASRQPLLR